MSTRAVCLASCLALLFASGCNNGERTDPAADGDSPNAESTSAAVALRVLVVDDATLAAGLTRWQHEWKVLSGGSYEVVEAKSGALPSDWDLNHDLVLYSADLLGELAAAGQLTPLRRSLLERVTYEWEDVFGLVGSAEIQWGPGPIALSLGTPVFTLAYRADLLEALARRPPATWAEYHELALLLSDRQALESAAPAVKIPSPWQGAYEPLAHTWAARVFLARAAAYARHRNQVSTLFDMITMEPLIDSPPFERALTELVAEASPFSLSANPQFALEAVQSGSCGMAICWPAPISHKSEESTASRIAFAELPGAEVAYNGGSKSWDRLEGIEDQRATFLGAAGRLGSVTARTRNAPSATRLLGWITGKEVGTRICSTSPGTTLFRRSQKKDAGVWTGQALPSKLAAQYAGVVEDSLARGRYLIGPRLPGSHRYLAALDEAVRAAAGGEQTPAEVLQKAATAWSAITDELGAKSQHAAYLQSLGREAPPVATSSPR